MWGLIALFFLLCMMSFCWLADGAPLVDDNEQLIPDEDLPRPVAVQRERFSQ